MARGRWSPRSWPIAVKMSADLLLAALIPMALAVWLTATQGRRELERSAREQMQLLATVTAARLDQLIVDSSRMAEQIALDDAIVALADAAAVGDVSSLRIEPALRRCEAATDTNEDYSYVYIADARGTVLTCTNATLIGNNYAFRDYFKHALAGEVYRSQIIVGTSTREPGIFFSAPIRAAAAAVNNDADGRIDGIVVIKFKGERIWELIDEVKVGRSGYAMLVDNNSIVTAHPDRSRLYHSIGPLSTTEIERLDPKTNYGISTIQTLGMPELASPLADATGAGSTTFTAAEAGQSEPRTASSSWVAGFAPLREQDWKVVVVEPESQFNQAGAALLKQQGYVALAVAALAGGLALWRARTIVRPVLGLTAAAQQLASGDFSARAPKLDDDEVGRLADAFNAMVPRLNEAMQLRQSMAVAMEVQQSLLPAADPEHTHLDISGRSRYCEATGGDYYDFIDVSTPTPGATLVAVGDVMGHGIAAALLMASARAALRCCAVEEGQLARLMSRVNAVLASERSRRFMTMALVVIDAQRGTARWASAGHDPTIVYHPARDSFEELEGGDVPLGITSDVEYLEYNYAGLQPGDVLILGTDGIWEMRSPQPANEQFGKLRLKALIRKHHRESAARLANLIESELAAFRGEASQLDDVTFVVIKLKHVPE